MTAKAEFRCLGCGTKIRNNRAVCPSCGMDLNAALTDQPVQSSQDANAIKTASEFNKTAVKALLKICDICLASTPEEQIVDLEGQKICVACADNMKNKAAKKAASAPPKK